MFFIIPIAAQLKRVLGTNWPLVVQRKTEHKHTITSKLSDICSGSIYQNLCRSLNPSNFISFVFHIGGAPTVKSKTLNMWPMQCFVVELPLSVRYSFKNIIFSGLWFLAKKPSLQLFQAKFVNQIQTINASGLEFKVDKTGETIYVSSVQVIGHLADLVAKAPLLNMKQFNGEFGCSICLHPGERVGKGRGNVRVYPVYDETPQRRDHEDSMKYAKAAKRSGKPVFGCMGESKLHKIFRIPENILLDYMHLVLEGEFLGRLSIWLDSKSGNGYLAKHTNALDKCCCRSLFHTTLTES